MINAQLVEVYVQRLMEAKDLTAEQRTDRTVRILQFQQAFKDLEASFAPVVPAPNDDMVKQQAEKQEKEDSDVGMQKQEAEKQEKEESDMVVVKQSEKQEKEESDMVVVKQSEKNQDNNNNKATNKQTKKKDEEKKTNDGGDAKKEADTIAKLKVEFRDAHLALMALFGYEYINRLPGYLYDGLPLNTMDKEEYQRRLIGADQELLSAAQVRDAEVERASTLSSDFEDKERIKRFAQKKYLDTVARINTGFHHFLHTITPIDAVAFNARRKELLDKKMAALRALRMLQIQGVEIGDLL